MSGRARRAVLRVGLPFLSICAGGCAEYGAHPKSPAQGGAQWLETDSEHFTVVSDLSPDDAAGTAQELEEGLDALTKVAFEHPRVPVERTTVVAFRDSSDFHAFLPRLVDGVFYKSLPTDLEQSRFLIVHGVLTTENRRVFFHELTHDLIERNFGAAPAWLNEGWAEYYSTLHVQGNSVIVGEPVGHVTFTAERNYSAFRDRSGATILAIPIELVPPPSALMHLGSEDFYRATLKNGGGPEDDLRGSTIYAGAWALVHMLVDGPADYQQRLKAFLDGTAAGTQLDQALARAFADLPSEQLDRDFRRYLGAGEIAVWQTPYERPSKPLTFTVRPLSDAEVHLYWARLSSWKDSSAAKSDLDAALASAPALPDAHYYRGIYSLAQQDFAAAEADLTLALKASPADPRFALAMHTLRRLQYQTTSTKDLRPFADATLLLARVARTAPELNNAAEALRELSHPEDGLSLAEKAVALAPYEPEILDTYAGILFDLDRVDEAVAVQTAAVSFIDEHTRDPGILSRLETYRSHATGKARPPDSPQ